MPSATVGSLVVLGSRQPPRNGWLTLVFVLSLVCMPVHAGENKNCGLKQLASLDLAQSPGHVLVPVTVQGQSVWMALHTGSAFSLIFDEEARALQLNRKRLDLPRGMSVGPKGEVTEVAVADLQMGRVTYRNASFTLLSRGGYTFPASFAGRPRVPFRWTVQQSTPDAGDTRATQCHGRLAVGQ
jgi:hypothetical protein